MTLKRLFIVTYLICNVFFLSAQCWDLVWEDDFSGTALNTSNWSHQIGASGWGNNELQYYTSGSNNITVSGGHLSITAKQESYNGANYTSARIRTINNADFTYGRMEASIQLPEGQGIWPAFWMMPTNNAYGGWPASGEMDIMEYLGHQTNKAYGTCHYGYVGDHQYLGSNYTLPSGTFPNNFHVFAMEWEPDTIKWFVDNVNYYTVKRSDLGSYPWVYDKDFHFILNVAVGGNWPGPPNGTTVFPQTMKVDYVRVYKQLSDFQITGDTTFIPGQSGVSYELPNVSTATYQWFVPSDATIVSGQGTAEIVVDFGSASGDVVCNLGLTCGTEDIILPVVVDGDGNIFDNPDFEFDYQNWNTNVFNGAAANFTISTVNPHQGQKSAKGDVTTAGPNPWSVQLSRSNLTLENGVSYFLKFWARGTAGVQVPFVFAKNQSPWTVYAGNTITINSTWTEYTLNFTSNVTDDVIFNLDVGAQTAILYFDDFYFGKASSTCPTDWVILANPADQDIISASNTMATFGNITVASGDEVAFRSGKSITLLPSFQAELGTDFRAYIESCAPMTLTEDSIYNNVFTERADDGRMSKESEIIIAPNPTEGEFSILGLNEDARLTIIDGYGKIIKNSLENTNATIDLTSFSSGMYFIIIEMEGKRILKRVVKL